MSEIKNLTELSEGLKGAVDDAREKMLEAVRERDAEMKRVGAATDEQGERIAELDERIAEYKGEQEHVANKLAEILEKTELGNGRAGFLAGDPRMQVKTIGQIAAETDEYQGLQKAAGSFHGASGPMMVGSFHDLPTSTKDILTGNPLAQPLVEPQRVPGVVAPVDRRLFVRDLLPVQQSNSPAVEWVEETATLDSAAVVAEGAVKPMEDATFALRSSTAKVIADGVTASRQILSDAAMLQQYIDDRITYAVKLEEERQLLYGDGTGENLQGLLTHTARQTYDWSDGETGDNRVDALRRAMNLTFLAGYPPTGAVIHPTDKTEIDIMKGDDGHYLWLEAQFGGQNRLIRLPFVESLSITVGQACVGAFAMAAAIYDLWQAATSVADQHSDYRRRNLVLVLGEERLMFPIYRPQAFVHVTFDAAPA